MGQKIVVSGTGGTIAGRLLPGGSYQAGAFSLGALLADRDTLELVDVAQLDSKDMDLPVWRNLVAALVTALARPDVQGVLVTHGTDTVEDTAWLVQALFGQAGKPIVFTCAMRPADHVAPDGPGNLADALAVVREPQAAMRGVLLVCAGQVHAAQQVRKAKAWALDAFTSDCAGAEGWVHEGSVRWRAGQAQFSPGVASVSPKESDGLVLPPQAAERARQCLLSQEWPWVEIITASALVSPRMLPALVQAGVQGVVIAATGAGTVHRALLEEIAMTNPDLPLVVATGCDLAGMPIQASDLPSTSLSPRKAKVSMALRILERA